MGGLWKVRYGKKWLLCFANPLLLFLPYVFPDLDFLFDIWKLVNLNSGLDVCYGDNDKDPVPLGRDLHRIFTKTMPRVNQTLYLRHKGLWVSGVGESRCISTVLGKCRNVKHQ